MPDAFAEAVSRAAARYGAQGRLAAGSARGKLTFDPVYRALIERGIARAGPLADLGCGRGLLLALVLESCGPARPPMLCGIEISPAAAHAARRALGDAASVVEGDLGTAAVPACEVAALLDVLHYLPADAQDRVLARVRASLRPGGRLFLREADAGAGAGYLAVRLSERLASAARGQPLRRFAYRSVEAWTDRLRALGFETEVAPMGMGTPFSNVLIEARTPA